jgi:predicted ATPase/DNA-binding SARP family transcriptional activator
VRRCGRRLHPNVWRTRKHAALLKILVGERGQVVPADRLIEWLWPDLPPRSGQANLYVGISLLRRVLEPGLPTPADSAYILTRHSGYLFDPSSGCWIDVDEFKAHVIAAQAQMRQEDAAQAIRAYEAAAALYRGDYLADDPYEDWAIGPREQLREAYLDLLSELHRLYLAGGDAAAALDRAQQALVLDPCREQAHRQVMRAYCILGRQADALRQFDHCRRILRAELDVEPMPRTLLLHQQILSGQGQMVAEGTEPRPSLGRLPFVGRESELASLRQLWNRVRREGCQMALVSGESGVGKTRLVEEFAAEIRRQGAAFLHAPCHALERDIPYQPLREALSEALAAADTAKLVCRLAPWAGVVAGMLPLLWEQCPNLEPPPALTPGEERARLLHGLVRLVQSLAHDQPLLLFVDDLHWADGATLQALCYLRDHLGQSPLLLLGACRMEESEAAADHQATSLTRMVDSLRRDGRLVELLLHRLTQAEVAALIAVLSRSPYGGKQFSQSLYRETEGNPFFQAETLRALLEQGVLYRDERGAWAAAFDDITQAYEELPIPPTVRQVVLGRCQQLSPQQQRTLTTAAIIGRAFQFGLWLQATGLPEMELVDTLECCLARHLLVRLEDGRYDFSHGLIREILVRELCPERRRVLHRQVAAALVELRRQGQAGEIAHHYLEAEMWAEALEYLEQAGHAALRLFAYEEAWPYFARAYEMLERLGLEAPERWYAVVSQMAHLCSVTGRREEAGAYLHQALALARASNEAAWLGETLQALCRHCFVGGELEQALALSEEAVALSQRAGDVRQESNALRQYGYLLYRSGQTAEAFETLEKALLLSRQVGERSIEAQNLNVLGVAHYYHGDYAQALSLWAEALHVCREIGFKPVLAQVAGNLGEVYRILGCYPQALAYRQEGLDVARAIGFRTIQPDGFLDLGMICSDLGRHQDAIAFVEEALSLAHDVGHRHFVVQALNGLAHVRLRLGGEEQAQRALALVEEALNVAREIALHHGEVMALSLRGQALLALGRVAAACEASQVAVDLLEGQGVEEGDERRVYFYHAQNLSAHGKASEAAINLAEAKARMEAKADRIADAELRQSFLDNVPLNRAIRQAWQEVLPER